MRKDVARLLVSKYKLFFVCFFSLFLAMGYSATHAALLVSRSPVPSSKMIKSASRTEVSAPVTIVLKVVQNVMQYDKKTFSVKAGQKVTIDFENPDFMQHNLVIMKPGTREKVGAAADLLAADPNGASMNYVPKLKEVLFSTKLLTPQEKVSLQFTAPAQPGEYPYMCTFPGHWRIMFGTMKVTK